jgi:hypothetical protein
MLKACAVVTCILLGAIAFALVGSWATLYVLEHLK